jgi:hypothetical protein
MILSALLLLIFVLRRGHYDIEDLFLITNSGLLVHHVGKTETLNEEDIKDDDIIASMFVAVQAFIIDAFAAGGEDNLKRMDYGDKTVMIYKGDKLLLSAFITGQATKSLYEKIEGFITDLEEQYKDEIEKISRGLIELPEAKEMLISLLDGEYSRDEWKKNT